MHHRVRRLRLYGVPVESEEWHHGYVDMQRGKGLRLSSLGSSPGMGTIDQLWQPVIVSWNRDRLRVRGIEPVRQDGGVASYVQEWEIELSTTEPIGSDPARRWVAPGFYEVT